MDASIKHYEEIEKRIKTYYPECSITQLGDKMIVEMPMGKLEVRGYRVLLLPSENLLENWILRMRTSCMRGLNPILLQWEMRWKSVI